MRYNIQTWFKVAISRSLKNIFPDLVTLTFLLSHVIFFYLKIFIQALIDFKIDEKYFNIIYDLWCKSDESSKKIYEQKE